MKVYCHRRHSFTDYAAHREYRMAPGQCLEVPDALAKYIVGEHPDKLCILTEEDGPSAHVCVLTDEVAKEDAERHSIEHTAILETPTTTQMLPNNMSGQKKRQLRKKLAHSAHLREKFAKEGIAGLGYAE